MTVVTMVITNNYDGTNEIQWVTDEQVLDRIEQLVDEGHARYASGDGLQARELLFPIGFDVAQWLKINMIRLTTLKDLPSAAKDDK